MGCTKQLCAAEKVFLLINLAFAMYAGALLATAARLMWDPSTYSWFRFLCVAQYRVSTAYVFAAGLWLAALVCVAAGAAPLPLRPAAPRRALHLYAWGVAGLCLSELAYAAWMGASLAAWWRRAPEAELARRALDLAHDLKPALLAVERYRSVAMPLYHMLEEVEREAPNNVFVIIVFGTFATVLQVAAIVMARRLARLPAGMECASDKEVAVVHSAVPACDEDSDSAECRDAPPGFRKKANLRMYTILDKIF